MGLSVDLGVGYLGVVGYLGQGQGQVEPKFIFARFVSEFEFCSKNNFVEAARFKKYLSTNYFKNADRRRAPRHGRRAFRRWQPAFALSTLPPSPD